MDKEKWQVGLIIGITALILLGIYLGVSSTSEFKNSIVNDYPETVSNEYVRRQVDNWWYYGMGQSEIKYDGIIYQLEGTNRNYFTRNDNSHLYENGGTSWTWHGLGTYELIYDYDAKNL